jgi:hypothetical protein
MIGSENVVESIVAAVDAFKKDHDRSSTLVEGICNIMTRLSYYKPANTDKVVTDYGSTERLRIEVEGEYFDQREKLEKLRRQISLSLKKLGDSIRFCYDHPIENPSFPTLENLEEMHRAMVQQTILEDTLIQSLDSMMEHCDVDTNVFVTIVASFKFSPYCNQGSIVTFLNSMK